jgi:hypothetical protein
VWDDIPSLTEVNFIFHYLSHLFVFSEKIKKMGDDNPSSMEVKSHACLYFGLDIYLYACVCVYVYTYIYTHTKR